MNFLIETVWKDMKAKWLLNLILFLLLVIGMLVPLGSAALFRQSWSMYRLARYPDSERLVITEYFETMQKGTQDLQIASLRSIAGEEAERVGLMTNGSVIVSHGELTKATRVAGCTDGYLELSSWKVLEGGDPEQIFREEPVCFLQERSEFYAQGVRAGDRIQIDDKEFTVAGVVDSPMLYGGILISYEKLAELKEGSSLQQQAVLRLPQEKRITKIRAAVSEWGRSAGKQIIQTETGPMKEKTLLDSIRKDTAWKLTASAALLVFTMISFVSIVDGMLAQDRRCIGIRFALGASFAELRRELSLRMQLLLAAACGADILLYPVVFGGLLNVRRKLQPGTFFPVWGIFAFMLWILVYGILRSAVRKAGTAALLKEVV